jgi:hypothetical protein
MIENAAIPYSLTLNPLRRDPHLAESIVYGLKLTLGVMFEDPVGVRDVIVAIRELLDNILTHADWDQTPAPSLFVRYRVHKDVAQLCISSTNVAKDIADAERALGLIREYMCNPSSTAASLELTAQLLESAGIRSSGGIGLLQVASSPSCHLEVRLEGALFHVRVDVDVPALKSAPNV